MESQNSDNEIVVVGNRERTEEIRECRADTWERGFVFLVIF